MSEYWEYVSSPLQLLPSAVVPSSLLSLVDVSSVLSNDQLAILSGGLLTEGADLICLILGLLAVLLLSYLLLPRLIRLISKTKVKLPSLPCCSGWSGGCGALAKVRSALGRLGKLISCCRSSEQVPAAPKPPKLVRLSTTFTISNFLAADLLLEKESYLESAVFSAAGHPKERFQLRVHPRAGKNGDEVSLFLRYVPVVETIAPPKGGGGVVAAAVESLEASAASLDVSSSSTSAAAATPAAAAAPVTKVATVHFVCRIGTPKGKCPELKRCSVFFGFTKQISLELKAQIKAGEGAGWVNFISREELLRVLDAKKTTNLTIQLQVGALFKIITKRNN